MIEVDMIYRHYKEGKRYRVLSIVKNSETLEDMVVYQALYGNQQIWVRPLTMWEDAIPQEKLTDFGQKVRFKKDYMTYCEFEDIAP